MFDGNSDHMARASSAARLGLVSPRMSTSHSAATLAPSSAASAVVQLSGAPHLTSVRHQLGSPVLGPSRSAPLLHTRTGLLCSVPAQPERGVSQPRRPSGMSTRPRSAPAQRVLPPHRVSQAFEVHVVKNYKSNQSLPFKLHLVEPWPGDLPHHMRGHLPLTPFEKATPSKPAPRRLFQSASSPALETPAKSAAAASQGAVGGAVSTRAATPCSASELPTATPRCQPTFGATDSPEAPGWSFRPQPHSKGAFLTKDLGAPVSQRRLSAPKPLQREFAQASSDSTASPSTSSFPARLASEDTSPVPYRPYGADSLPCQLSTGHLVPSPPGQGRSMESGDAVLPLVKVLTGADTLSQPRQATPAFAPMESAPTPNPAWTAPTREVSASDLPHWRWPEVSVLDSQMSSDVGEKFADTSTPSTPFSSSLPDSAPADQVASPQLKDLGREVDHALRWGLSEQC